MELAEIKESVKKIIIELGPKDGNSELGHISEDVSLIDSGFIDSLGAIQIIEALSEKFDVLFFPAELSLDNFDSINKISHFVRLKLSGEEA